MPTNPSSGCLAAAARPKEITVSTGTAIAPSAKSCPEK